MFYMVKNAHGADGHLPLHERTADIVILGHGENRERPKYDHYENGGGKPYGDKSFPESHVSIIPRKSRARNYTLYAFIILPD